MIAPVSAMKRVSRRVSLAGRKEKLQPLAANEVNILVSTIDTISKLKR